MLKLWRETGDVVQHNDGPPGCPHVLTLDDVNYLLQLVNHHPGWFLDELPVLLSDNRFISIHYMTIY